MSGVSRGTHPAGATSTDEFRLDLSTFHTSDRHLVECPLPFLGEEGLDPRRGDGRRGKGEWEEGREGGRASTLTKEEGGEGQEEGVGTG